MYRIRRWTLITFGSLLLEYRYRELRARNAGAADRVRAKPDELSKIITEIAIHWPNQHEAPTVNSCRSQGPSENLYGKASDWSKWSNDYSRAGYGISENEICVSSKNSEDQQKRGKSVSAVLEQLADGSRERQTDFDMPRDTKSLRSEGFWPATAATIDTGCTSGPSRFTCIGGIPGVSV